jgi:hypothetical protein
MKRFFAPSAKARPPLVAIDLVSKRERFPNILKATGAKPYISAGRFRGGLGISP